MDCKYFGKCGSCNLHDIEYTKQLIEKKERVKSLLSDFTSHEIEVFSYEGSNYRARAEFRIWHDGDNLSYAMSSVEKKKVVQIESCPKVVEGIEKRMNPLLEEIKKSKILKERLFGVEFLSSTTDDTLITLLYHKKLDEQWNFEALEVSKIVNAKIIGRSRKQKVVMSDEFVIEKLNIEDKIYTYKHYEGGFTQPNPFINEKMISWAKDKTLRVKKGDLLESYCGLGNFTIPLSASFDKVLATEISKRSIQSAKENCELNSINNIEFIRLSSEEMSEALSKKRIFKRLEGVDLDSYDFSCVLVDPPRAGLDNDTIHLISNINSIIYISCNPETLARDLETLCLSHEICDVAIFDQFPYTHHVESGVFLQKR
ncbi:MAG: tRNA (uridine(54)-C5)-methyltransferase TrmA [Sulfurovum sp.]|nr:MAG: tRNA (uridine(54)-C5)-methyltransferase TrmA [Sulfurovum sp.]